MLDYIDGLSDEQFLARYEPQPKYNTACDDTCASYGYCLRGDCFEQPTPPQIEDSYDPDVVPNSLWRQYYEADAYDALLRKNAK